MQQVIDFCVENLKILKKPKVYSVSLLKYS